jgi:hypothetical protein
MAHAAAAALDGNGCSYVERNENTRGTAKFDNSGLIGDEAKAKIFRGADDFIRGGY